MIKPRSRGIPRSGIGPAFDAGLTLAHHFLSPVHGAYYSWLQPFDSVLRALGEPSFVLPVEGMPGDRYLPGVDVMDLVEQEGEDLALQLFGRPAGYRATLQPHSGTQANQIVYNAVLEPER